MKKYKEILDLILRAVVLIIAAFTLLVGVQGCQKEEEIIIEPDKEEVITSSSSVYTSMMKMATKDGSHDNILDHSSCTSVELPIVVKVNGVEVKVESEKDFYTIEKIIDEEEGDKDILTFIFPITVVLSDFSKIVIESNSQFEHLIGSCTNGEDDDIECIDFKYPLLISTYNTLNIKADIQEINSDEELFHFLHQMKESDIVGINFPITLLLSSGNEIEVNDNIELNNIIAEAKDYCDEDDDIDHNDDDADTTPLLTSLLDGYWEITQFTDESVGVGPYEGYVFKFFENGSAIAFNATTKVNGKWSANGHDGTLRLELYFGEEHPANAIHKDWRIFEFNGYFIKLYDDTETNTIHLKFERPAVIPDPSISNILPGNSWIISQYKVGGDYLTSEYSGYTFEFKIDGSAFATKTDVTIQGSWLEITENEVKKLSLKFSEAPFGVFEGTWNIYSLTDSRIELRSENADGVVSILVFER